MTCDLCGGSGLVVREDTLGRSIGSRECSCVTDGRRARNLTAAGIPRRYWNLGFDQYDGTAGRSAGEALMICRRYAEEWPMNRALGLLLIGPTGVGKTHLACATLIECARKWKASIAFVDLADLLSRIKSTFNPSAETEDGILKPILAVDILAIDEVGAPRRSDWAYDMTERIIQARYNAGQSTLFTDNRANQPPGWVAPAGSGRPKLVDEETSYAARVTAMPTARKETLGDVVGQRMWSRLQEMTKVVEMDGVDQRAAAGRRRS